MSKSSKTTQILITNILFSSVIKENTGASVFMFSEVHTAFGNIFLEVGELMQCETGLVIENVGNCKQSLGLRSWREVEQKSLVTKDQAQYIINS